MDNEEFDAKLGGCMAEVCRRLIAGDCDRREFLVVADNILAACGQLTVAEELASYRRLLDEALHPPGGEPATIHNYGPRA